MMRSLTMLLATGFYSGLLPKAPGTWGSLVALPLWYLASGLSLPAYLLLLAIVFVVGFFAAGSAEKILDQADAGPIVIDEILGMLVALTAAPPHAATPLVAFLFFRLFDIWKPFPVSWVDQHLHGGLGIMLDDVVAGCYALLFTQLLCRWLLPQV